MPWAAVSKMTKFFSSQSVCPVHSVALQRMLPGLLLRIPRGCGSFPSEVGWSYLSF